MVESCLMILGVLVGVLCGMFAYDFSERRADKKAREALKSELKEAAAGLSDLHNKNAEVMRHLQDKVTAHAVALSMRGGK